MRLHTEVDRSRGPELCCRVTGTTSAQRSVRSHRKSLAAASLVEAALEEPDGEARGEHHAAAAQHLADRGAGCQQPHAQQDGGHLEKQQDKIKKVHAPRRFTLGTHWQQQRHHGLP